MAMSSAMIAMTTSNSMRVKALLFISIPPILESHQTHRLLIKTNSEVS
jgi:hypothetical protein